VLCQCTIHRHRTRTFDEHPKPMAMARRWYSNPSPCCVPVQFIKKPSGRCTAPIVNQAFLGSRRSLSRWRKARRRSATCRAFWMPRKDSAHARRVRYARCIFRRVFQGKQDNKTKLATLRQSLLRSTRSYFRPFLILRSLHPHSFRVDNLAAFAMPRGKTICVIEG